MGDQAISETTHVGMFTHGHDEQHKPLLNDMRVKGSSRTYLDRSIQWRGSHSEWSEMHWYDSICDRFEAKIRISPPHIPTYNLWAPLRRDERSSSRPDALIHPLGDVGLQPDDRVRPDGDLLGEGALSHSSVDGGATDADAMDDL